MESADELRVEVEELRASRARVVASADAERRRIERELHDGAQQHLVALAVNLELARQLADTDPGAVTALLEQLGQDVRDALETVRELAHGIYPPLLLDRGLADALSAAASSVGLRARVDAASLDRYPAQVESTAYFCCLAALLSAAARGGSATRATVRVWQEDDALCFEVVDDATVPTPARLTTDLTDARDRTGAMGGELTISSGDEQGTRVVGRVPLRE